jgi:hypothetical protein
MKMIDLLAVAEVDEATVALADKFDFLTEVTLTSSSCRIGDKFGELSVLSD